MGLQWWEAEGQAPGCSDGDGVIVATGKESIRNQGKSSRPAPLCSLVRPITCHRHIPFPGPGHLSSVEWRCSPTSITRSKRPPLGTGASRQPCGPRDSHSKGHLPSSGTGPQIGISALPSGRGDRAVTSPFADRSTSAKPTKAGFSNKINMLVCSVFCNFC